MRGREGERERDRERKRERERERERRMASDKKHETERHALVLLSILSHPRLQNFLIATRASLKGL